MCHIGNTRNDHPGESRNIRGIILPIAIHSGDEYPIRSPECFPVGRGLSRRLLKSNDSMMRIVFRDIIKYF